MEDQAIKAVSAIIQKLPGKYSYKVVFMQRPIDEVVASQRKMLEGVDADSEAIDNEELARRLEGHRGEVLAWLSKAANMDCLLLDYPELVSQPQQAVEKLSGFLGDRLKDPEAMLAVIDPALHRNRSGLISEPVCP